MAIIPLKIVKDDGAVTRKVKLDTEKKVQEALKIVREKFHMPEDVKDYGLFLRSHDNELSGIWLEPHRTLGFYMLRPDDRIDYMSKIRNLRVRMLDDTVKTLQVDQSKKVSDLMISICGRIGITNHEEYGLCMEQDEECEESKDKENSKELKPGNTGTLTGTVKRKMKARDLQMEQLSKKLKTDDNVQWIDSRNTLSEACIEPNCTVLFKRRLFYSDRNVDSRDPVQLNLLYVQARDNILNAQHPVTEDQAAEFAGIQCQIHFDDFQEDKHKPGFIENLREYLPEQFVNSWGIEKKILKEYRKHHGLNQLEAKHLYTKTARALPTYGVTFFLVKERQNEKKKLIPRLLGINSESILRLDAETKEILQVWPLTQVKTYHAGKGETFTLNFGDYSDKEYCVKTQDAYRIRDILEGYIDIIRKRMLAEYDAQSRDHGYIGEEMLGASQANIIQHIANNSSKLIEHSFVGPTKIVSYEPGQEACQGTQIVTVKQLIISEKGGTQQRATTGEVPLRADMSMRFSKSLNRLNSNSVKIVTFLTEPSESNIENSKKIVADMEAEMPYIREGVKETMAKQSPEEAKKLQDKLAELEELIKTLSESTADGNMNTEESVDAAKNIADLTTQMYFAMDRKVRGRSDCLLRQRPSFVEDEATQEKLRRASFIAATAAAMHTLDQAQHALSEGYDGPSLSDEQLKETERCAVDHLAKLNGAIANYIVAHSDPKKADYNAAVNSMNTVNEYMPEFVNDIKALASIKDSKSKKQLLAEAKQLCEATTKLCSTIGSEDGQKIQEASKKYSDVSGRLIFTLGGGRTDQKKVDEVIDLAKQVRVQSENLVQTASLLAEKEHSLNDAGKLVLGRAEQLVNQAQLTGPTINEPHCQSALTATAEALSSSVEQHTLAWKPLMEDHTLHELGDQLHHQTMKLAHALDTLKNSYSGINEADSANGPKQSHKLLYVKTASEAKKKIQDAEKALQKPTEPTDSAKSEEAKRRLAERLAQLNASIASLITATSDKNNPDYATAELAVNTIVELMPQVVQDAKVASANEDETSREALLDHIRALCDATSAISETTDLTNTQGLNEAISKYNNASGKLVYVLGHKVNPEREQKILELSAGACGSTSELLLGVQQLAETVGGERGEELDLRGARLADDAQNLLTTAQSNAPSISDARCQSVLLSAIDKTSSCAQQLAHSWAPLAQHPQHKKQVLTLYKSVKDLEEQLENLRKACLIPDKNTATKDQQQKLKFTKTKSCVKDQIKQILEELEQPLPSSPHSDPAAVDKLLAHRLALLNAAIASLLASNTDRENPDYHRAEQAVKTISQLMPQIVQDTRLASVNKDEASRAAMLDQVRALCEATSAICSTDSTQPQALSDAVAKYTESSGKLVYTVSPYVNSQREQDILELSAGACGSTSELLLGVQQLAETVGGERGEELDLRGARLADHAQNLLTQAQLTASSISDAQCQAVLLSAIDKTSSSAQQLAHNWAPLAQHPQHKKQVLTLQKPLKDLEIQLEKLRKACRIPDQNAVVDELQQQKLKFTKTKSGVKDHIKQALEELQQPLPSSPHSDPAAVDKLLAHRLALLNAAIASLLASNTDRENADYHRAEQAVKTISQLMPQVVQDTRLASLNKDEANRAAMLDQVRALCEATSAICSTDSTQPQDLSDAVAKYTESSGKLVYTVSPYVNSQREQDILELSAGACGSTSELLLGVQQLAETVGGERGEELDLRGARLADDAQNLLTQAQLTASSICDAQCQAVLLSAIDKTSSSAQQLAHSWAPLAQHPQHKKQVLTLQKPLKDLEKQLEKLRKACQIPDQNAVVDELQQQKLKFTKTKSGVKDQIKQVLEELQQPLPSSPHSDPAAVDKLLAHRLALLNAAIASLLASNTDRENPDYQRAEKAVKTISQLMPQVVQDTRLASVNKDEASRAAMLDQVRALCEATSAICSTDSTQPQALSNAVAKYTESSGKLVYTVSPYVNPQCKQDILELSAGACGSTSELLLGVQQLAETVGGERGEELDLRGARLADDAQNLLTTAQITASCISEPQCKSALLSAIDKTSSSAQQLAHSWAPLAQHPQHKKQVLTLEKSLKDLEDLLERLRKAFRDDSVVNKPVPPTKPEVNTKPAKPEVKSKPGKPAVPVRVVSTPKRPTDLTKEFLDRIRCEESQALNAMVSVTDKLPSPQDVKTDDEKRQHQLFLQTLDLVQDKLLKTEESLVQVSKSSVSSSAAVSASECLRVQERVQQQLALAAVEVAALVSANYADKIDYSSASKSTTALPKLISGIVEDGKVLSSTLNEQSSRKAFLDDMLQLCQSTNRLCDSAKTDREKLNASAIDFGNKSAKLLYAVSNDVDPTLEEEISVRAAAVGDSASRLAGRAGDAAAPHVCRAAAAAVDAAGKLVYTAKLVAPSIYETPCQEALISSADNLSSKLKVFTESWKPLASDPHKTKHIKELAKEADNLTKILEGLKSDVKGGKIGKRREMEKLVVEDTPMRMLTLKIIDDSKKLSLSEDISPAMRQQYLQYTKSLSDALRELDLANARCKRSPHDTNRRRELENAVQELQMIVITTRPTADSNGNTRIVDLNDFIKEVTSEAQKLSEAAGQKAEANDRKHLQEIKSTCSKITEEALQLSRYGSTFEDILEVDQFGQDCDDLIKQIDVSLQSIEDGKLKKDLMMKSLQLTESCNMLRFATKSAISTSKCSTLESTLDELDHIENNVIKTLVKTNDEDSDTVVLRRPQVSAGSSRQYAAVTSLCAAARDVTVTSPAPPLAHYITSCANTTNNNEDKNKLQKHLYKLVHLLKTLTVTTSKRLATWQKIDEPEVTNITQKIIQEIQNPESKFSVDKDGDRSILNPGEVGKLLIPGEPRIIGDQRQQEDKMYQLCGKVTSMCANIPRSVQSVECASRSGHAAAAAALELAAVARGCKQHKDLVQSNKLEESIQEMTFYTYNLLKNAEQAAKDPKNPNIMRRLQEACRTLNNSTNKLIRSSTSSVTLRQECCALAVSLKAAASYSPASYSPAYSPDSSDLPTHVMSYQNATDALYEQKAVINKLNSDQSMSRSEFAQSLSDVTGAVFRTSQIAEQCTYLISICEHNKEACKKGLVDVPKIEKTIASLQDSCMAVIGAVNVQRAKEETADLGKRIEDFSSAIDEAQLLAEEQAQELGNAKMAVTSQAAELQTVLAKEENMDKVLNEAVLLLDCLNTAFTSVEKCCLVPAPSELSNETKTKCDEVMNNSKSLVQCTLGLVQDVSSSEDTETMTWTTFNTSRRKLMEAYDVLMNSVKTNGKRFGILIEAEEEPEPVAKTYLDTQVALANKWLLKPMAKETVKTNGQAAVNNIIEIGRRMSVDLSGTEKEEMRQLIMEVEELMVHCTATYNLDKYRVLADRVKELKKSIQRGVVNRVVEDFIDVDNPMEDLELLVENEKDVSKRKYILERKIAELLGQLSRVTTAARVVSHAAGDARDTDLRLCTEQTELLAPMLVKAAEKRVAYPDDQQAIDEYKALVMQYAESLSRVRELCDKSVDPMEFVQAAGDTMQRMREEAQNDPQTCAYTSQAIIKLANRSIEVSLSSLGNRDEPEVREALKAAQERLAAATYINNRASRQPDWKNTTAEILRTTGEVESALGGENIFKKQPTESNQQIFSSAQGLYDQIKEWSSRDNEVVAAARRMAVLMAKLSEHMHTDNKKALLSTSKSIVLESQEVTELAKKLAHECTDVRIKNNLLQTCERIPTISGQLKMLTTVKGSSLGHQGSEEDKAAMDMLVGNADSLMQSIKDVVKAAASASVKIMSQRGPRLRWVRKNY